MRWLVLLALSGCLMVPRTMETTTPLERTALPTTTGPVGPVAVAAHVAHGGIEAITTRTRHCTSEIRQRFVRHRSIGAELVGPAVGLGQRPDVWAAMVVIDAPFFVVSAAVTGIAVAASSDRDDQYVQTVGLAVTDCPLEAPGIAVAVVMPSGAIRHGVTDDHGRLTFRVPDAEPDRGTVIVRAGERTAAVPYQRTVAKPPRLAFTVRF